MSRRIPRILGAFFIAMALTGCEDDTIQVPQGCKLSDLVDVELSSEESPVPPPVRSEVTIDPASLREELFSGGVSLKRGTLRVHQAKEELNIARARLLPSLNLGVLLDATSGAGFGLALVESAFPFLLPANWFNYFAMKDLVEAEKATLWILKLNQYASAYSALVTVGTDLALREILAEGVTDSERLLKRVELLHQYGLAAAADVHRARAELASARIPVEQVEELLAHELASLKKVIGVGPLTRLNALAGLPVPVFREGEAPGRPIEEALARAPEAIQVTYLRKAATQGTWAKKFGFITGVSIRSPGADGSAPGVAFDNASAGVGLDLGFAIFPMVRLSQLHEREFEMRQLELEQEIGATAEMLWASLKGAAARVAAAEEREQALAASYLAQLRRHHSGLADLGEVIRALEARRQASIEALAARSQLSLARVSAHRILLSGEFSVIQGCEPQLVQNETMR